MSVVSVGACGLWVRADVRRSYRGRQSRSGACDPCNGSSHWRPIGLQVTTRNGIVHLYGIVVNPNSRQAAIVAAENITGVKEVHDHLCFVDSYSGFYVESLEDMKATG